MARSASRILLACPGSLRSVACYCSQDKVKQLDRLKESRQGPNAHNPDHLTPATAFQLPGLGIQKPNAHARVSELDLTFANQLLGCFRGNRIPDEGSHHIVLSPFCT
ncbi:hypothetical protein DFP72DRAFT_1053983 [Ephemerocybe angulata]|uniref:Uncharacterized protein n=1 Tax=Ephemerocybe angulata TaxID=980116 RepID=A0A8H6H8S9_9AGAR|nr:hypothetical protein DFP72DRAFT_1053983 [Tulosesus angulatus]